MTEKYPAWMFIVFPAISMLLGWGLRGYIGGGPFGAMIPGALVAISISMLLELPVEMAAIFGVFAVVGIGIGGEMTYGQTLGFLKNPDTVGWGLLGTTIKGSIWGLLGGIISAMGLIYKRLSKKVIILSFIILLVGMLIGLKLINQPQILYFSGPEKPRPESWGALLMGAVAMLVYLKYKIETAGFRIISRFALLGLLGGGLGFGLGSLWMVLGFHLSSGVIFRNWWKAMEFSFGLLFGAAFGYAAWLSRKEFSFQEAEPSAGPFFSSGKPTNEFLVMTFVSFLVFWFLPFGLDPMAEVSKGTADFTMIGLSDWAKIFSNFAFFGFIMVIAIMKYPSAAWQIVVTITFCHTVIDLMGDYSPNLTASSLIGLRFAIIVVFTTVVALLTAYFQRHAKVIRNMFLLLIWSSMLIAFLRLALNPDVFNVSGLSVCEIICGRFFVHLVFLLSALFISWISVVKISSPEEKTQVAIQH